MRCLDGKTCYECQECVKREQETAEVWAYPQISQFFLPQGLKAFGGASWEARVCLAGREDNPFALENVDVGVSRVFNPWGRVCRVQLDGCHKGWAFKRFILFCILCKLHCPCKMTADKFGSMLVSTRTSCSKPPHHHARLYIFSANGSIFHSVRIMH